MPRWRGLNHFAKYLSVEFSDGSKWEDMSKVCHSKPSNTITFLLLRQICVLVLRNYLGKDEKTRGILRCARAYVELDMLASFNVHTDTTISMGRTLALKFSKLANVSRLLFCT